MGLWERARDHWLQANLRQGDALRRAQDYAINPPVAPAPPVNMVRTPIRDMNWGIVIPNIERFAIPGPFVIPLPGDGDAYDDDEWHEICQRRQTYRALTTYYECNLLINFPLPRDHNVIWRWMRVKRTTPAGTEAVNHPIFTQAIDLLALFRLSLWESSMLFCASTTAFYNYNLTGSVLQGIRANVYANRILRQFAIEMKMLTRESEIGLAQPRFAVMICTIFNSMLRSHVPHGILGIHNWACIQCPSTRTIQLVMC